MAALVLFIVPYPDVESAERSAQALLEEKLIACSNFVPVKSAYWWKGRIERRPELLALLKTTPDRESEARAAIERLHPYDVPAIERIEVSANAACEDWIRTVLG